MLKAFTVFMLLVLAVVAAPLLLLPALAVVGVSVGMAAVAGGTLMALLLPLAIIAGVFWLLWLVLHLIAGILGVVLWSIGMMLALVLALIFSPVLLPILVLAGLFWLVLRVLRPQPAVPALPAPTA